MSKHQEKQWKIMKENRKELGSNDKTAAGSRPDSL